MALPILSFTSETILSAPTRCRIAAGVTQEDLARRMDWPLSRLVNLERDGYRGAPKSLVEKVLRILGYDLWEETHYQAIQKS